MKGKSLVESKTFWINVLGTVVQVLPDLAAVIPQPYGIIAMAVINIVNRLFFTEQPITIVAPDTARQ